MSVVGARPNFMKIAPFIRALARISKERSVECEHILVHTGQHYDARMSGSFFDDLNIPDPDINLEVGSGSAAEQLGTTMIAFEKTLLHHNPDWVVVVGDVNATLACSVVAKRHNVRVCHIEAGLRSGDMTMPEEINRLVTDRISDLLLTPDTIAASNLRAEGVSEQKIHFVGNIMIDTLDANLPAAKDKVLADIVAENLIGDSDQRIDFNNYGIVTLHRPSNVDRKEILQPIVDFFLGCTLKHMDLVWPMHPRTKKQLSLFSLWSKLIEHPRMAVLPPLGYHEMLRLNMSAKIMLTDSGGLQEECCVLGTPFLTLRSNTERPITLQENGGLGILVGNQVHQIEEKFKQAISSSRNPVRPQLWDGNTSERIVNVLLRS